MQKENEFVKVVGSPSNSTPRLLLMGSIVLVLFIMLKLTFLKMSPTFHWRIIPKDSKFKRKVSIIPSRLMTGDTLPHLGRNPFKYEQEMLSNFPVNLYEQKEALEKTGWKIAKDAQACKNATELPNILNIRFANKYWQLLRTSNTSDVYLLSAFLDNRHRQVNTIRIIAGFSVHPKEEKLFCHTWYNGSLEPEITKVSSFLPLHPPEARFVKALPMWHFPYFINCNIEQIRGSQSHVPLLVSVLTNKDCKGTPTNLLKVHYKKTNHKRHKLGVCLKRMFTPFQQNVTPFIEWVEANLLLGVAKIFVYVLHVHPNIMKVFDYYWKKGILEVRPVTNPGNFLSWSPLLFKRARHQSVKVRWHTDEYDYYDCLMRNRKDFEFLAMIDIDELLVPTGNQTLTEFLHKSQVVQKGYDAISFMNVFHNTNASQALPHKGNFILGNTERAARPEAHPSGSKVIFKTNSVLTFNNHYVTRCLRKLCKPWLVQINEGESRHYKAWGGSKRERVNASKLFFNSKLEINAKDVLSAVANALE